ncbi:MAG: hydantoinase/oxoprolinase N-terminal domain-containing protein [Alphaproteobacteria bacterium]|jgi:N-methylhydantoinase A|nr:hydantoinase/oxoprolinase N-terminal domain-containing protein [Alphaproteobacteria bacterium]
MVRVGVEVGGTFTDLVLVDATGVRVEKVPSTPGQPDLGAMNALAAAEVDFASLDDLVHGSTVAMCGRLPVGKGIIGR